VKIKLDENLPHQLVQCLTDLGHDVDAVLDEIASATPRKVRVKRAE
jgi:predicted nuclease of predicted toxin-antitoxin system